MIPLVLTLALLAGDGPTAADLLRGAVDDLQAGRTAQGLDALARADRAGNTQARELLGEIYFGGLAGVKPDPARGCGYFEGAAQAGLGSGAHNYAQCFYDGSGRRRDLAQARAWYAKAIGFGFVQSRCALGNMLVRGEGGEKNAEAGLKLCREGAEAGDANAQTDLGEYYLNGQVLPRDFAQAHAWFEKAAAQGHANALFHLGSMSWNGDGTPKDRAQAGRWYRQAYEAGRPEAALYVADAAVLQARDAGMTTPEGRQALEEARRWYGLALKAPLDAKQRAHASEGLKTVEAALAARP
ncbi:MAG: sel1 repeat family protein [Proteobacteria bacterium]|nr:sel1 repeat family protein [Pseudomonadota bacterium]